MFLRIIVFYVLTWFFIALLAVFQQATGLLPPSIGLPQWGPGLAALAMQVIFRKDGHKIAFISRETPALHYVYAALLPVVSGLVIFLISRLAAIQPSPDAPIYDFLLPLILWMPLGAIGEELGWRGYLHKKLDTRMRGLYSSLLVGILWAPIHVTFFSRGPIIVFFLFILIISYAIVIYALVQDTGFSVALASVFHLFINLANLLFLDVVYETRFMIVNALVWATVAVATVIIKRDLFFSPRGKL
jgi:membrane protease YdiL (CAAX protease family)